MGTGMRYLSVCSGIDAVTVAWKPLGWEALAFSEIEAFPSAVLKYHYPNIPNLGDMTKITGADYAGTIDVLVGGTPCQDFSIAGLRAGLDGERGNLTMEFIRLLDSIKPQWFVWENVPGVLSIDSGRAFGRILNCMGECGYGVAYRVLDAQYFGVAQRRRRVFVVGYFGDWRPATAVLFERNSLQGYPAPSRESREVAIRAFEIGPTGNRETELSPTLDARCKDGCIRNQVGIAVANVPHSLRAQAQASHRADSETYVAVARSLTSSNQRLDAGMENFVVADTLTANWHKSNGAKAGNNAGVVNPVIENMSVRRLTPVECERLQGFPDNYTRIPWRGKPAEKCPDGPRYRVLGNSMAVPVMCWLGERIEMVEGITLP